MATARASELPVLIIKGTDSPRSRIGRGLESIGGMTAETLQRLSTAVGGVVKSPVVLMTKVGGLGSPRAATLAAPPGSSLEERVHHLEIQMKNLEEKFSSMTIVTELDLSTRSHKEKPRIAKSLLQEMEMDRMLENRVQMLEDCVNERMDRFEKALLSIQSRLDHVDFSKHERMVGYEHEESVSGEPQYYDAEQQSDNFEALEAIGGRPTLEKSRAKETLSVAPTIVEHIEPLQEIDVGKNDDFLDPQVVSTPVYSKEAFLTQPMKSVAPSSEPSKSIHRNDASNLPSSLDQQLASTLEDLHGSFVMESSAAIASAKFLEIARAVTTEKNTFTHASSELQSTSILGEPQEASLEESSAIVSVAKSEEHAQEDIVDKSGTTIATMESPSPPTFEAIHDDFTKELLVATPNAKLAQELATQGVVIIALASPEPPMTSKCVEEPLMIVPSANSEELAQEDASDKSITTTATRESPKAFAFQDLEEDSVKKSLVGASGAAPTHKPSSREDLSITSDIALTSSESLVASKSAEEPLATSLSTNFEELAQEDDVDKSSNTTSTAELPLVSSLEEPLEDVKEFMVATPSDESAQVLTSQEDNDMQVSTLESSLESQMASKFVEEPSFVVPSVDSEKPAQKDAVGKIDTMMATTKSSSVPSLEEPKESFEKESMASASSSQPTQEHSNVAIASFDTKGESKSMEEASVATPSANFKEHEHKDDADESSTITASAESPLASSFNDLGESFEKESLIASPSIESTQDLATQEDSSTLVVPETTRESKFMEDPSIAIVSADFEEPAHEDVNKVVTMTTAIESPLPTSHEGLQEDFEKESLATTPNVGPIHETSSQENLGAISDKALASSKSKVASKFVEEPLSTVLSAKFEELAHEDKVDKSVTMIVVADSPLASSYQGAQEEFEKESLATIPSIGLIHEPSLHEDLGVSSDKAPISFEPKVASKFVEEPSATVPSVDFEELAHEDEISDKNVIMTIAKEDPREDFVKESLTVPLNVEPTHKLSSQEDFDATSDMALASSTPHLASKFVEKSSPTISSVNSEEPTQDKDVVKSDTMSTSVDSPLVSSFEEPQEDFKESLAATSSHEPTQELAMEEDSHLVSTSSKPQEVSKSMEEPLVATPSVDFEEPTHENVVDKNVAMPVVGVSPFASSFEGPQEDSQKESVTSMSLSTERAKELTLEDDSEDDSDMAPSGQQVASKFVEEPLARNAPSAKFEEPAHEDTIDRSGSKTIALESPSVSSLEVHKEDYTKESLVVGASEKVLEPTKEDESRKNSIASTPSETPPTSVLEIPQKAFLKEPSRTSIRPKEPMQEKSGIVLPYVESTLTSTVEEDNYAAKEAEYKLAEDFKAHHEDIKSIEKEFPESQSNLVHIGSDENLIVEDSNDRLESDQSGEEFFDAEHGSGNFEPWESDESKSFEESSVGPNGSTGINVVAHKATLVPTSSVDYAQELEQVPAQTPAREFTQETEQTPVRELGQRLDQTLARELEQDEKDKQAHVQEHDQQPIQEQEFVHGQHLVQEYGQQPTQEHGQETRQEHKQATSEAPRQQLVQEPRQEPTEVPEQQSTQELVQEFGHNLEQQSIQEPMQELEQEDLTRNNAMALLPLEPHVTSKYEESQELFAEEPLAAVPSTKFEDLPQANATNESGTRDLPLTSTTEETQIDTTTMKIAEGHDIEKNGAILVSSKSQEEPQESFTKEPLVDVESISKSIDPDESLADKPSAVTSAKLAQESIADKISVGLIEESPLTSIAEEPQNGSGSSLVEVKHGQNKVDEKFLEDVKIIPEPIEEAIPRTQSDLTHVQLSPKIVEDDTKLQSQGSFLAFGATSVDFEEALVKETLPSTKLLELFEEENNSRKKDPMLGDSPMTFPMEEPQKPLTEDSLASAKSVPKGHVRRRGFARSSSEPQFAYKLEEHRKALAKESSVAAIPSASKLGEEHIQEDFGDTQCLPFKILGEGKHPRKELEFKLVEDVKSPATISKTTSSPYVLEPQPSKIKEKKKKEKKERKPNATPEEKERRLSLGLGEMERKSSLRAEEKDSKYSPRGEEKHKQPFRHLRDRLRHAFSVNKEP